MTLARWIVRGTTAFILAVYFGTLVFFPEQIDGLTMLLLTAFILLAVVTDIQIERLS